MRGKKRSDEQKAAVLAALLAGQMPSEIEKSTGIPVTTIYEWRNSDEFVEVRTKKRAEIEDLVVGMLTSNLGCLRKINEVCSDPDWIKKQPASELATFYGVTADKDFRLLEAIYPSE